MNELNELSSADSGKKKRITPMKIKLIFYLLILPYLIAAQDWAPNGAIWHYTQVTPNPYFHSYTTIQSIGDTLISGRSCKKLIKRNSSSLWESFLFMYSDSNRVYFYNSDSSRFCLLYDFNASIGDTFFLDCFTNGHNPVLRVAIIDTSSIILNGQNLKLHYYHAPGLANEFSGWVIEKIGHQFSMFPTSDGEYFTAPLRCYEDSLLGRYLNEDYYWGTGWDMQDCEQVISTSIKEFSWQNDISISPNPATSKIYVSSKSSKISHLTILDISGKKIFQTIETTVPVSEFPHGLYFVEVKLEGGESVIKKIISQ